MRRRALRSVTSFHQLCLPAMAMDSLPILPGSAKDLNSGRDSGWAFPQRSADLCCFDQAVSVRRRDSMMGRPAHAVYRAWPNSADPFDSRDFVPGFADSVVPGYPSPAVDLAFVDPGFVVVRLVIAVAVAVVVVLVLVLVLVLSFDPSCSADFSATLAVVASA